MSWRGQIVHNHRQNIFLKKRRTKNYHAWPVTGHLSLDHPSLQLQLLWIGNDLNHHRQPWRRTTQKNCKGRGQKNRHRSTDTHTDIATDRMNRPTPKLLNLGQWSFHRFLLLLVHSKSKIEWNHIKGLSVMPAMLFLWFTSRLILPDGGVSLVTVSVCYHKVFNFPPKTSWIHAMIRGSLHTKKFMSAKI